MNEISLLVNNKEYNGWKSVEVQKGMEQLTGMFALSVANFFPEQFQKWEVKLGDFCTIKIDGVNVISGYIDSINPAYDAEDHTMSIRGRDVTADLVDSSYALEKNEWIDTPLKTIVTDLISRFDIGLVIDPSVASQAATTISRFKASEGDRVLEIIARLCLNNAILPISYGDGKLTLTKVSTTRVAGSSLERGVNVKSANGNFTNANRYTNYIVKGQGYGDDDTSVSSTTLPHGKARDAIFGNDRFRPLVILAETITTDKKCKERANWEARIRAGNSRTINYVVQGWKTSDGNVWDINSVVKVSDSFFEIENEMLISSVLFSRDEQGTNTQLTVVNKETYELFDATVKEIKLKKIDPLPKEPALVDYAPFNEQITQ